MEFKVDIDPNLILTMEEGGAISGFIEALIDNVEEFIGIADPDNPTDTEMNTLSIISLVPAKILHDVFRSLMTDEQLNEIREESGMNEETYNKFFLN